MPQRGAAPIMSAPPGSDRGGSTTATEFDPLAEGAVSVKDFDPLTEGAVAVTNKRSIEGTPELDAIRAEQARKYPSAQERPPKPGYMATAARAVVEGLGGQVDPNSPIIGTAKKTVGNLYETGKAIATLPFTRPGARFSEAMSTPEGRTEVAHKAEDVAAGVVHMPSELVQGLMDGDPERVVYGLVGTATQVGSLFLGAKGANTLAERTAAEGGISARMSSAAANMIQSGVSHDMVNDYARAVIPIWRQAAGELGVSAGDFPARGLTNVGKEAVTNAGKKAIDTAEHAVDITNRPFLDAIDKVGEVSTHPPGVAADQTVKSKIIANLRSQAAAEGINKPLADALLKAADLVEKNGDTFRALQDLKVLANKKAAGIMSKSVTAQANATAEASYAWRALGDSIRAEMYPELQRLTGMDLSAAGRLEAMVMDARDGIYQHYYKDVLNPHNARIAQSYLEYVADGSQRNRSLFKRAMLLERTPAGSFNKRFGNLIGTPPTPSSVPYYPGFYNHAPADLVGTQLDLLPTGAVGTEPLLAPPPASSELSGRFGGTVSPIAEALYRMQQRIRRQAEGATPETLAGTQQRLPSPSALTTGERTAQPTLFHEGGISQEYTSPEQRFQTQQSQQRAARRMEAKTNPPPKKGTQGTLEPGMGTEGASGFELTTKPPRVMSITTSDIAKKVDIRDLQYRQGQIEDFLKANPASKDESILRELKIIKDEIKNRRAKP